MATRHRLIRVHRCDDVAAVSDDVVALHSSDPVTVFLSAAVRMIDPSVEAIEAALYRDRSVLRHHAMRRTLWVMTPGVAQLAHAATGRKVAARQRQELLKRLAASAEIDNPDEWLDIALERIVGLVSSEGSIMTRALGDQLPELKIPLAYPGPRGTSVDIIAHTKVIQLAGFEGRVVRTQPQGTWIGSQYSWAPMDEWLAGGVDTVDERKAMAGLVQRWLERFGPGTETDLVWWTGSTKTAIRRALADTAATEVGLESGGAAWLAAGDDIGGPPPDEASKEPWVAVLPGLDPTVMGWKERSWYLDDDVAARVFDRNGNAGPTVMVDGQVVGGWGQRADGALATELYRPVSREALAAIDVELDRLHSFIGDTRFKVRFPSPNQAGLLNS